MVQPIQESPGQARNGAVLKEAEWYQHMEGFKKQVGIERRGHMGSGSGDETEITQSLGWKENLPNL